MNTALLYWLLFTLAYAAFELIIGGGVYLTLRAIEMWDREYALLINALITVALLIMLGLSTPSLEAIGLAVLVLVLGGVCGFKFHLKSGGESASSGTAMLLMGVGTLLSMMIGAIVLSSVPFRWPRSATPPPPYLVAISNYLDLFLLFVPVVLTPFLLWVYQNSYLRPGLDRHLEENEEAELAP